MKKKKYLIWTILFVAAVLLFSGMVKVIRNKTDEKNKDKVVLRFAVTSKTYVFDEGNTSLENFINKVYEYADTSSYGKVDAFIINGNVTGDGSTTAFKAVTKIADGVLRKGSKLYTTMGEMDFVVGESDEVDDPAIREKIADESVFINGYGFIFMSPVYTSYESKLEWLDKQLSSMTENNNRPVFVFQYAALKNTFYGSETWYTVESEKILDVLEKYDTVVDFASSTGSAANTVRSVYQKNASYVNTGVLTQTRMNYQEFGHDTSAEIINQAAGGVSQCKIVEVYGDGKTEIFTMDLNTGNLYQSPDGSGIMKHVLYPGNAENYYYTKEKNISGDKPVFNENAQIEFISVNQDSVEISFENASDRDGVLFYNIIVSDQNGNIVKDINTYADFAQYEMPEKKNYVINNLQADTAYQIKIIPFDMFGVSGNPINTEFKTSS